MLRPVLILSACLSLGACETGSKQIYYWGSYEAQLYELLSNPNGSDVGKQIRELEQDIERSEASQKPLAPGLLAHLGFLYSAQGNYQAAQALFEKEKVLYPESRVFIDRVIESMEKTREANNALL